MHCKAKYFCYAFFYIHYKRLSASVFQKLYKQLYDAKSSREQGTLAYFKTLLRRTDVTGKVKSNFQGHADLIKIVVKGLIVEQFLSFFDMQNENDHPTPSNIIIPDNISSATKINKVRVQQEIFESFLKYYGYIPSENIVHSTDELFNYCNQLCLWGLQFFEMEDTAKEGDICRVIPNLSHNISFFYSHSCLSKYMAECVDYILKVEFLSSPLNKLRILEGSFVNVKGGTCNNIEADLVQEHHVRHQKDLIKQLGANKSNEAISRTTNASNILASIIDNFDKSNGIKRKTPSYTKSVCTEDEHIIRTKLRELKPFNYTVNRNMEVIRKKSLTPFCQRNDVVYHNCINNIIDRVKFGYPVFEDNDSDSEHEEDDDADDEAHLVL